MTDIAREAGVSMSTVSHALSGERPLSDGTRVPHHFETFQHGPNS